MANKEGFIDKLNRKILKTDDVFWENEVSANRLVAIAELCFAVVLIIAWVLSKLNVFELDPKTIQVVAIPALVELLVPCLLCIIFKGGKKWLKWVMLLELVFVFARADSLLSYNVTLVMVVPIILTLRYCSKRLTAIVGVLTMISFALSAWYGVLHGILDINMVDLPIGTQITVTSRLLSEAIKNTGALDYGLQLKNVLLMGYLPKLLVFSIITNICIQVAEREYGMVIEQAEITKNTARIETELNLAKDIQANMLPQIFPPFPDRDEFEIYGTMTPAKEVGGDLFDFYMLDDDHLAITIADVSGKGVPAALFMVTAKTLIKDHAYQGMTTGGIFTKTNKILCEGNGAGLFVTAWMAVINVRTGETDFCNAGHNPPIVKHGSEGYDYLRTRPHLVLAGMDGIPYKSQHLTLEPGDVLFLYTDGITEAVNVNNEQYGEERLIKILAENDLNDTKTICENIKADVDKFAGEVEQFDDMTMLALKFRGPSEK